MLRQGGKSTCMTAGGKKTVNTTWDDGTEMIEEYDPQTDELMVRKRRQKTALGGEGPWEYLVGDAPRSFHPDTGLLAEASTNPAFSRKDSAQAFEWRVRNLPYPVENYAVTADAADRTVVIRTANKKYFKKFKIPELDAAGLPLDASALSWSHANNTLVVAYRKPKSVLDAEKKEKEERGKMAKEGDVDCKQQ